MPQLMPLMWIFSVIMSMFLFMMLINMYSLKEVYNLKGDEVEIKMNFVNLLW